MATASIEQARAQWWAGETRSRDRRGAHHGHGHRLTMAIEALEAFPALAEPRRRLISLTAAERPAASEIVTAAESDVALTIAMLRRANAVKPGGVSSVVAAVQTLTMTEQRQIAADASSFDFFERAGAWDAAAERFRLHALATQRAAEAIARTMHYEDRDRLMVTSLLHDIGKLVLIGAYASYHGAFSPASAAPEERLRQERRELGFDHALVGGVLARRWQLPNAVARMIEHHHAEDPEPEAGIIRLADMLAHYGQGEPVAPSQMQHVAERLGLGPAALRTVMYELPAAPVVRERMAEPCPLSPRELGMLQRLAEGKVYKEIARELGRSSSTVRTHLHNIYGKLGVADRAQAVLIANERGWLSV